MHVNSANDSFRLNGRFSEIGMASRNLSCLRLRISPKTIRDQTNAGLKSARERGRIGGRPPALSAEDLQAAKAMLKDPNISVAAVAGRLRVAPSTLYRHIPHARSASLEGGADS